jgi:hypothetical protein
MRFHPGAISWGCFKQARAASVTIVEALLVMRLTVSIRELPCLTMLVSV